MIGGELRRRAEIVGVFVNAPMDEVASAADRCMLTMLQFHGEEGPAYCREAAQANGRADHQGGSRPRRRAGARPAALPHRLPPARHAFDGGAGGTGESFDWRLAKLHGGTPPLVLSGGLNAENVGEAIAAVRPYAVDSASGTEAEPGRKDPARLEAFFAAVAAADDRIGAPA